MDDAADDAAIVGSRLAPRVGRQMRREPRKLSLAQPEAISIHQRSPFGDLESETASQRNPLLWVRNLGRSAKSMEFGFL
jgi:hypothetical protein